MPTFRLDKEPWIPIVGTDGVQRRVNLHEVFTGAKKISRIDGSPLVAASVIRFLLAISHLTQTPTSLKDWSKTWKNRKKYFLQCAKYILAQTDAWDLYHQQHPFGQILNLKKTLNPAHILIYEAARKNNAVFIDHSLGATPTPILNADLACGIITTNAFAGSSGGGYRSGPLAMRTIAMLCGTTLDETLMLNLLVQQHQPSAYDWKTYGHAVDTKKIYIDLVQRYLWTSRQIRLIPGECDPDVSTIMLAPGNEMPESARTEDPMVAMRKDFKGKAYVPLRLDASRALWRSAHVLLNWQKDSKFLAAVDQLNRLVRRDFIDSNQPISMRVCAVAGEAQGPSTELWRDETLTFGLSVISDESRFAELVKTVEAAEAISNNTQKRIHSFAKRYIQNGATSSPDKKDVKILVGELSHDSMEFWRDISPIGVRIALDRFDESAWFNSIKKASMISFERAVNRLPPTARRHRAQFAQASNILKKKKGASA